MKDAPEHLVDVLSLRQQLAKSSVKKYTAIENAVCMDSRVRGMFQFYGANRTGRFAGRLVQLRNLPQNHMPDLAQARGLVRCGNFDALEFLYDDIPDTLSQLIRTAFVPQGDNKFIVADFSAIEARVLAWLADEKWRIKVFEEGKDIYCSSASQMFGVPVEKHGVNGHLRQKGKIAELALGYGGSVGALKAMGAIMCMIYDNQGNVLVEERLVHNSKGLIFPGGHVESNESVADSLIREIQEETGLTISNLQFCGIKDWIEFDGSRYMVFLYKTNTYSGNIQSSSEGEIFWMPLKELKKKETLWHLDMMLEIFEGNGVTELYFNRNLDAPDPELK